MSNPSPGLNPSGTAVRAARLAGFVERMARGDQDALSQLYDETSALLNGLLLRMLEHPQDAEEALLDVYMKAWKSAGSWNLARGSVQAWLVIIARSVAIDKIRQMRVRPALAVDGKNRETELIAADASPEQQTEQALRRRRVITAMRELPPEQREVLELAFFRGFTHSELAKRLGEPLGTVKSRIRLALLRLKELWGEEATA